MKKLIITTLCLCINLTANASFIKSPIDKALKNSNISKSAISISVKEVSKQKSKYSLNKDKPMIPASTQKIVTYLTAVNELGTDYKFQTKLYEDEKGTYFVKLGADPFLTSEDLQKLWGEANLKEETKINNIYVDDTILDKKEWGEGWQWDDDLNPYMPKFGAYNLDKNMFEVNIHPTQKGKAARIFTSVFYPTAFMNEVITGSNSSVNFSRANYISPDVITACGEVATPIKKSLPINHLRRYFCLRMDDALRAHKLSYYSKFPSSKLPEKLYYIGEISHPLKLAEIAILKNSDNMVAETVFKLAAAHKTQKTGTFEDGRNMFLDYCKNNGLNTDNIKIVDASGVSKNNLMTTDFMTDFLVQTARRYDYSQVKDMFATAGEGTLSNRMLYFKDNLYAKTGTLDSVSAIAGYITATNGKIYAFSIMINDAKSSEHEKKMVEEYIIRGIYKTR